MSLEEEQAQIYPQLASALIEATPEWWTHATLELDCNQMVWVTDWRIALSTPIFLLTSLSQRTN